MKRLIPIALIVAAFATAGAAGSAPTTRLCVGGPRCYPTLQAALNAAADGDTVRVGPGSFAGGVTITHSINLAGVAAGLTRIVGGGPVVTIGSRTSTPTVTISNLTITGGLTTSDPQAPMCGPDVPTCGPGYADSTALGGGIEAFQRTTVTIVNSAVTGNRAVPAQTAQSVKATCPGNVPCPASFGDAAGIDDWGAMTIIGTAVTGNHAAANQSDGGGIVVESGASLALRTSLVADNVASAAPPTGRFASGGGIFVDGGGTLDVESSAIDRNTAALANSFPSPYPIQGGNDQANSLGGGVFLSDGASGTIRNTILDGNAVTVATPGDAAIGADAALCACGQVPLTIANSAITRNVTTVNAHSSDDGPSGGIVEADGDAASITNTVIDGNSSVVSTNGDSAGVIGALQFYPGDDILSTLANSAVTNNTATANAPHGVATDQGAGLVNNGPLTVTSTTIKANRGSASGTSGFAQGAGLWNGLLFGPDAAHATLTGSQVTANVLTGSSGITRLGGGIFNQGGLDFIVTLAGTLVAHNTPDDCSGC